MAFRCARARPPAYGFGSSGATPLSWTKLEGGASTYFGLGQTLEIGRAHV